MLLSLNCRIKTPNLSLFVVYLCQALCCACEPIVGKVVPKASLCIWGEVYDNSKYNITMQLFCTKLNKKGIFNKVSMYACPYSVYTLETNS